ncbi:MAG: hypothetical protein US49_C0007G0026 [candidate division TM6 bacterium GW2011_GWF2_37_49]|nr:MAG: hypothetical protein US49_C0007G0026 [candidate division TM6 bacterium GW2011_GWF2_37_49]
MSNQSIISREVVENFLKQGGGVDAGIKSKTLLTEAVRCWRLDIVKLLLEYKANPNLADEYGNLPLYLAISRGNVTIIKLLLEAGANPNQTDNFSYLPLTSAVINKDKDLVILLLKHGANHNQIDKKAGMTPAALCLSDEIKALLDKPQEKKEEPLPPKTEDPKIVAVEPVTIQQLFSAIDEGDIENVKKILAQLGINVKKANNDGYTPLYLAVTNDKKDIAKLLLDAGADVNQVDTRGNYLLADAILLDKVDMVKLLLEHGAKCDSNDFGTPLHKAIYKNIEIVKLILGKVDVNAVDNDGNSALFNAMGNKGLEVAELLIKNGADVNQANNQGETPLHKAVLERRKDEVELLIKSGADVNKADKNNNSPLTLAINLRLSSDSVTSVLTKDDIDARYKNFSEIIALLEAASKKSIQPHDDLLHKKLGDLKNSVDRVKDSIKKVQEKLVILKNVLEKA